MPTNQTLRAANGMVIPLLGTVYLTQPRKNQKWDDPNCFWIYRWTCSVNGLSGTKCMRVELCREWNQNSWRADTFRYSPRMTDGPANIWSGRCDNSKRAAEDDFTLGLRGITCGLRQWTGPGKRAKLTLAWACSITVGRRELSSATQMINITEPNPKKVRTVVECPFPTHWSK